jgi:proliferating cell nuclear antigen
MEIVIDNHIKSECFTTIFQHVRSFTESINLCFSSDGMSFQTMDTAHVSIVELNIPKEWFSRYICSQDVVLGINVSILHKILTAKEKAQILKIGYNDDISDKLEIHFMNHENVVEETTTVVLEEEKAKGKEGKGKREKKEKTKNIPKVSETKNYDKHFEIPLMDLEMERMEIPEIEYEAEFSLASTNFSNIVNQLKMFGDTMEIQCSEEQIVLYSNSTESGKMSVEISVNDLTEFSINEGYELKLSFSLVYLQNICAFNRLTMEIEIKICSGYPLCALYNLGEDASMRFYLAPKLYNE